MINIVDQNIDKSQKILVKAANQLENKDFANKLPELISKIQNEAGMDKTASDTHSVYAYPEKERFPVTDKENTLISKVYFDYQKSGMDKEARELVEGKLDVFLNLYEIPYSLFETHSEKTASNKSGNAVAKASENSTENEFYLLPSMNMCKVASKEDLQDAVDTFVKEHKKLDVMRRVEFSENFVKAATKLDFDEYPTQIAKYAGLMDTDRVNLNSMLEARAAAASRSGQDGSVYRELASSMKEVEDPSKEELSKLASVIHNLDEDFGFTTSEYDNLLPNAYLTVFNKQAGDFASSEEDVSAAEIVARYGEESLEAVEDEDGNIDIEKLKNLERVHGGTAE